MSTMRSSFRRASRRPSQPPEFYARMLGFSIRSARLMDGRSLEELAPLARSWSGWRSRPVRFPPPGSWSSGWPSCSAWALNG